MRTGLMLVDFDNFGDFKRTGPGGPKQHHIDIVLEQIIEKTHKWIQESNKSIEEIYFRFYGGWFPSGSYHEKKDRHTMLSSSISKTSKRYGKHRVKLQIAETLAVDTNRVLLSTFEIRPLRTKIRIDPSHYSRCRSATTCAMKIAAEWLEFGCPSPCNLNTSDIFTQEIQKTIDTNIVCDTIYYSSTSDFEFIGIVSGDYDLVPGLIYASKLNANVVQFRTKERLHYDHLISECEIVSGFQVSYSTPKRG